MRGDIHHLFPKDYLKKHGLERGQYNQIANYVYMQSEINIKIGNKPPKEYLDMVINQNAPNNRVLSGLSTHEGLLDNLSSNCIPEEIQNMEIEDYPVFLEKRRILMSKKNRNYYFSL